MIKSYSVERDGWLPISSASKAHVTLWGLDDYDPSSMRFQHAYMMERGGPDGSEWYCGLRRVYPAFWQHIVGVDAS